MMYSPSVCVCVARDHSSNNFMAQLQNMTTLRCGMDLSRLQSCQIIYS